MAPIISIEHVTKTYRLGSIGGSTLQGDLTRWWARMRGRPDPMTKVGAHARQVGEQFWALDDVSFQVKPGEVLGVIGRNGAGKSTLLKILSQVTAPSEGQITLRGRVASLLEVGTGFHPDLTGRENIFLNGAILGMTKAEIRAKFDEIVAFSECGAFIDTPVKRYSSGMYVRLAFAVAAHLEPEILIVDEVLAVGDVQFQKKCLGKMQDVGKQGRTILFVSHTMSSITRLCSRAVLLSGGKVVSDGPVHEVVQEYLGAGIGAATTREWSDLHSAPGDDAARLVGIRARDEDGSPSAAMDIRKRIAIEVEYEVIKTGTVIVPSVQVSNSDGVCVFVAHDWDSGWRRRPRPLGRIVSTCWIPGNFLAEGTFVVGAALTTYVPFLVRAAAPDAVVFEIVDSLDGNSARGDHAGQLPGVIRPSLTWTTTDHAHATRDVGN